MTPEQRTSVIDACLATIEERFYEPTLNGVDIRALTEQKRPQLLASENFVGEMQSLVKQIGCHPLDFYHESGRLAPFERAVRATLHASPKENCWVFQDVHPDGLAHRAGITPGARLRTVNDQAVMPPDRPRVSAKTLPELTFEDAASSNRRVSLSNTAFQSPQNGKGLYVLASTICSGIGYLKVTLFPGLVGVDLAKEIDDAIGKLAECSRLIVDLRGNPGGGAANLRLMSYLTSDRIPVGYSLTRRRAAEGYRRENLPKFRRIPSQKWLLPFLALRFRFTDKSIVIVTEGLPRKRFHGRIVMLVNEHTGSGSEIVADFAQYHGLATVVGTPTMGRLLGWSSFPVGEGYRVVIPVSNYLTWEGRCLEGQGVTPPVCVDFSEKEIRVGRDVQLEKAVKTVRQL